MGFKEEKVMDGMANSVTRPSLAFTEALKMRGVFRKGKGKVQRVRLQAWHGAGTAVQTDGTLGKAGTA